MATTANYVKFLRGTPEAYNNLAQKDSDTLYFISATDSTTGKLYLGEKLIAGSGGSLTDLEGIIIENIANNHLLVYDEVKKAWVNKSVKDAIGQLIGATSSEMGKGGLVPAPGIGEQNYFLRGDGTWAPITVDGVSTTKVFEVSTLENEDHPTAIARIVGEVSITNGDIVIVKDLIYNDKYQYTAYVNDGSKWIAMDGNYNAENVYFNDDILVTTKIGTIQDLTNGQATLEAKGKNVKQVLSSLLAKRENPKATLPDATITLTNEILSYEVGTKVIPTWKTTFSAGQYTYGPATGVTDTGGSVVSTKDTAAQTIIAGSINNSTGSFAEYQVEDGTTYKATLTYGWNAGTSTPVDNFGDEYTDSANNLPINSASNKIATSSNSITGFRKWFKGGLATASTDEALTSTIVRDNLEHSESAITAHTFDLAAADYENCKRVVIAIPANSGKKLSEVLLKSTSNLNITT